jgi:hypothetical protein
MRLPVGPGCRNEGKLAQPAYTWLRLAPNVVQTYAALRAAKNSPMRPSAAMIFSAELA